MSLSYGFYNSHDHDRVYNATQMSQLFDGIITDGVFYNVGERFMVKAVSSSHAVTVGTGRAWFNSTWTYNDSDYTINIEESEIQLNRIDAIVLEVNANDSVRRNYLKVVKGTPATNPVNPNLTNTKFVHQHALAYVRIPANSTKILQSNITINVGTSTCPYVTGPLKTINADDLLAQWKDQAQQQHDNINASHSRLRNEWIGNFDRLASDTQGRFDDLYEEVEGDVETTISTATGSLSATETALEQSIRDWYDTIRGILDEDAAGNLQNEIDDINSYQVVGVGFNDWTFNSSTSTYVNTVAVNGITADSKPILDVRINATSMLSAKKEDLNNWAKILNAVTGNGTITLYAASKPTSTFYMVVKGR